jgi:N-acetyl sugar amidotransferase
LHIDEEGVCDACRYAEKKLAINWTNRERELVELLGRHRRDDGRYDCIVPGSGGKDSGYAAHVLKYKYEMHPLTVTWPPTLYTDYGYRNFRSWVEIGGFDNITLSPNGKVHRKLTRLATENLLHPFQTFILGQKNLGPKLAILLGIPLVFYGEPEAEYGNPIAETQDSLRNESYYTMKNLSETYLGGISVTDLIAKHDFNLNDLMAYLPADANELAKSEIQVHYLGYYLRWIPQEAYYYAVKHTGFQARPFRTEGTYSKYNSIDDKIDDLHYYTTYIKFGLGRASYDASQEIRNRHLTREEGISLVKRFDGEFPKRYFDEIMSYLDMTSDHFEHLCETARSPHIWKKEEGKWILKHPIWEAN